MTIYFDAEIRSIKTCVDHSFMLQLNIPEYNVEQVQEMMTMLGDMVAVAMVKAGDDKSKEYGGRLK